MRRRFKSVMAETKNVKSDSSVSGGVTSNAILGVFEGECADSNITNKNGLDITREVWENVFESEEYKQAIELGWFIGYLGHPDDPGCMDFKNACIVMTDGYIDEDGKVFGTFNLIDTPVGRIVKSFIDAGVTFGISVRGAGDITGNSVDPETFVFRGFDLVSFPAFPESIPTFTEIAASTDLDTQKKYKNICDTLKSNLQDVTSNTSIDMIQSKFAKQSNEYRMLAERKNQLSGVESKASVLSSQKLEAMTSLYAQATKENAKLKKRIRELQSVNSSTGAKGKRLVSSMKRIYASQLTDMQAELESLREEYQRLQRELSEYITLLEQNEDKQSELHRKIMAYKDRESDYQSERAELIASSTDLERQISTLRRELSEKDREMQQICANHTKSIESLRKNNLIYKQKISQANSDLAQTSDEADDLYGKYVETVSELETTKTKLSNLDDKVKSLQQVVQSKTDLAEEYRRAYIELYCGAVGIDPNSVYVKSNTGLNELKAILSSTEVYEDSLESELLNDENDEITYDATMLGQDIVLGDDEEGSNFVVWQS